jgi:hypothetical protein
LNATLELHIWRWTNWIFLLWESWWLLHTSIIITIYLRSTNVHSVYFLFKWSSHLWHTSTLLESYLLASSHCKVLLGLIKRRCCLELIGCLPHELLVRLRLHSLDNLFNPWIVGRLF